MPADNELDPLDRWLNEQVRPLSPPSGTFELIRRRARRRRIRKAVISVASAAVVAAAVGVAVPVGMSLHLSTTSTNAGLAAGSSPEPSGGTAASTLGTASKEPGQSASNGAATASSGSGASAPGLTTPGYLPPNFQPSSVTWDSLSTGWIMGPAGTPGHCGAQQDSSICTSIARTDDGGQTWHGLPAPDTGGPMAATGVTGLRFLNATYGWAFGPELWATDDGGEHWHSVNTGGLAVTDLETASGRAYALFSDCTPPAGTTGDTIANCTHFTFKTTTAGSDAWTPVGGVPVNLNLGPRERSSAVIELAGATGNDPAAGYLVAPDGMLYSGPLDGTAWHEVAKLPCSPGATNSDGLPRDLLLTPAGTTPAGTTRLAIFCLPSAAAAPAVYVSTDNGATWAQQAHVGASVTVGIGSPQSLTALPNGTLILATEPGPSSPGGIYLLPIGAPKWQPATLSSPSALTDGFRYVGMTGTRQGVALSANPKLGEIWMTTDGGKTWQARPIKS
ncbi:MAG: hypothetical protein ACRDOI_11180 [Trebonia sp.]